MNARSGLLQDTPLHIVGGDGNLTDVLYYVNSYVCDSVLSKKVSKDITVNEYGRQLIEFCIATGFRIMNGRLYSDRNVGDFTYESNMGKSVIDLLLCKSNCISLLGNFSILPMLQTESDHKHVVFSLKLHSCVSIKSAPNQGSPLLAYKWSRKKQDIYLNSFENENLYRKTGFTINKPHR